MKAGLAVLVAGALAPGLAGAQGTLSVQGLGYPPGQLSARSLGTGGALAEMDPTSPLNPAAIIEFNAPALSIQMAPEFRRVTNGATSGNSSTQRFPVFIGALPFGQRLMVGVSSSTLLDRSWSTTAPLSQVIRGDTVQFNSNTTSDGAVNDVAVIAAYTVRPWLRVGVAAHGFTGRDVVTVRRTFQDTVRYGNTVEPSTSSYSGNAVSLGVELVRATVGGLALSYRRGGALNQMAGDSVIERAHVPDRFGAGVVYTGLRNATLAARTSYDRWSSLGTLGGSPAPALNSWDTSLGAELVGPHFASIPLTFRLGGRMRDLPFPAAGRRVRDLSVAGGLGLTLAQGHALLDLSATRSRRTAGIGATEAAWTIGLGFTIRP